MWLLALMALLVVVAVISGKRSRRREQAAVQRQVQAARIVEARQPNLGTRLGGHHYERLKLAYTDADGSQTVREVTVNEVWGKRGDVAGYVWVNFLVGHCHLRREQRHFRVDRIAEIGRPDWKFTATGRDVEPWVSAHFAVTREKPAAFERRREPSAEYRLVAPPMLVIDARGEVIATLDTACIYPDGVVVWVSGRGKRERAEGVRAWSGHRTFDVERKGTEMADAETGEAVDDLNQWVLDHTPDWRPTPAKAAAKVAQQGFGRPAAAALLLPSTLPIRSGPTPSHWTPMPDRPPPQTSIFQKWGGWWVILAAVACAPFAFVFLTQPRSRSHLPR